MKLSYCRHHKNRCEATCEKRQPTKAAIRAGELFDYLANSATKETIKDIAAAKQWSVAATHEALRAMRLQLGETDPINAIAEPTGHRQPWGYQLAGTMDKADWWFSNRTSDIEGRLETIGAIAKSLVNATDGRTIPGKKARMIAVMIGSLLQQLALIGED